MSRSAVLVVSLAVVLGALNGCALTSTAPAGLPDPVAFSGQVIGGENPIAGATVSFYETAATGVATNGVYVPATPLTPLGSTVTDANGNFVFATALACASMNDYVYATAAGGNSGSGINPDSLLMSAVGSCSGFGSSSFVVINELSTVAAAYALQGFTSVSGSYSAGSAAPIATYSITNDVATFVTLGSTLKAGQTVILSGFPTSTFLNNQAFIVLPTGLSGSQFEVSINHANVSGGDPGAYKGLTLPVVSVTASATNYAMASATPGSLSAAGLAHAFANAANLKTAGNSNANTSIAGGGIVPAGVINALGNSLQACVNSTGGSSCTSLFGYTTNPYTSVAPTNTLSATLNIARFPTQNVYNICELAAGQAPFAPAVACAGTASVPTAPRDWSIAIVYPSLYGQTNSGTTCNATYNATTSTNGLCYPLYIALDASDNAYVLNGTAATSTASNVVAMSSSGTPLWASALDTTDVAPELIAADGLGNVFYTNNSTSTTTGNILQFTASSGTPETTITGYKYLYGIALDSNNKLWVSQQVVSPNQDLLDFTRNSTGSGYTYGSLASGVVPDTVGNYADQIAFDPSLNIWMADYSSSTAESPMIYDASHTTAEFAATGASWIAGYGIAIDSNGNAWADSSNAFYMVVAKPSGGPYTAATVSLATNGTYTPAGGTASLRFLSVDGNDTIWAADDNGTNSAIVGYPSAQTIPAVFYLRPCIDALGTTCAAAGTYGVYDTHQAVPDSTGSLWVPSDANGTVTQIIGAAAPTWPLLSDLKPGVMP